MKTQLEILQYIEEKDDYFGFAAGTLAAYLDYDRAKPFLEDDFTAESWTPSPLEADKVIQEMREYMDFAIDKAESHRGLSASRSIARFRAWLWLLEDVELLAFAEDEDNYANYGAPILLKICQKYKFDFRLSSRFMNMANGAPCEPDCDEGCLR